MYINAENCGFIYYDGVLEIGEKKNSMECFYKLGRYLSEKFYKVYIGMPKCANISLLYSLAGGLSESGCEIFVCESTDPASFRFSIPVIAPECAIYIDRRDRLQFHNKSGIPCNEIMLISNDSSGTKLKKNASIHHVCTFEDIYISNLINVTSLYGRKLKCTISCGNHDVKKLWEEFFEDDDGEDVIQVSENGTKANIYTLSYGCITHERLILAYIALYCRNGKTVFLPDSFHYSAELIENVNIIRYNSSDVLPDYASNQRFIKDPLYLCIRLMKDRSAFNKILSSLPEAYSLKRQLSTDIPFTPDKAVFEYPHGRILTSSAKGSLMELVVQSESAETSAEICEDFISRIRNIVDF